MVHLGPLEPVNPDGTEPEHPDDVPMAPTHIVRGSNPAELAVLVEQFRRAEHDEVTALAADQGVTIEQLGPQHWANTWAAVVEDMEERLAAAVGVPGIIMETDQSRGPLADSLIRHAALDANALRHAETQARKWQARADLEQHRRRTATPQNPPPDPPVTEDDAVRQQRETGIVLRRARELADTETRNYQDALLGPVHATRDRAFYMRCALLGVFAVLAVAVHGVILWGNIIGVLAPLCATMFSLGRARSAHLRIGVTNELISAALERRHAAEYAVTVAEADYLLAGGDPTEALPVPVSDRTSRRRNHRHGTSG